jgi:hypothetical protein
MTQIERSYFLATLRKHRGCIAASARASGLARGTLIKHLNRLGIDAEGFRRVAPAAGSPVPITSAGTPCDPRAKTLNPGRARSR